jgi:hypothetical protein
MNTYRALTTIHPMWIPAAVKAAQQGNAKGLYRPPGYEGCCYTVHRMPRADNLIRWSLSYRMERGSKSTTVANWITDWLPDAQRQKGTPKPIKPPTEPIRITSEGADFLARVVLDHLGLPRPVPVGEL